MTRPAGGGGAVWSRNTPSLKNAWHETAGHKQKSPYHTNPACQPTHIQALTSLSRGTFAWRCHLLWDCSSPTWGLYFTTGQLLQWSVITCVKWDFTRVRKSLCCQLFTNWKDSFYSCIGLVKCDAQQTAGDDVWLPKRKGRPTLLPLFRQRIPCSVRFGRVAYVGHNRTRSVVQQNFPGVKPLKTLVTE